MLELLGNTYWSSRSQVKNPDHVPCPKGIEARLRAPLAQKSNVQFEASSGRKEALDHTDPAALRVCTPPPPDASARGCAKKARSTPKKPPLVIMSRWI